MNDATTGLLDPENRLESVTKLVKSMNRRERRKLWAELRANKVKKGNWRRNGARRKAELRGRRR